MEIEEKNFSDVANCPIRNIVSHFSGKWSLLALTIIDSMPDIRFNELGRQLPDISPKVLSSTLRQLENDHLILRKVYPEVPPRTEYSLTPLGRSLMPHIRALIEWSVSHREEILKGKKR